MKKIIPGLLMVSCIFFSCKKDVVQSTTNTTMPTASPQNDLITQVDKNRTTFTQILAKAVTDERVRNFIKKEASDQFDNDFDVLYQLVKDKEITPGYTFRKYLSTFANSEAELDKLTESLPLLTILVPELSKFSNEKWSTNQQVPLAIVVTSNHFKDKKAPLKGFDASGNEYEFAVDKQPHQPVIIVKENDRVAPQSNNVTNDGKFSPKGAFVFKKESVSFHFIDDAYDRTKNKPNAARIPVGPGALDQRLKDAYALSAPSQRDYVYYNILNPNDVGVLNNNYSEYLTGFSVENPSSMSFLYDDPTSDFSDGAMEFQMDVLFFDGSSTLTSVSKVFSIARSDLISADGVTMITYMFPNPIPIATWDMKRYGDTWKYVVHEIDPSTVTTSTKQSSSTLGSNFQFNASLGTDTKIGTGFGGSATVTHTNTTTVQVTTGSDFCGEAIASFMAPLVTGKTTFWGMQIYSVEEYFTGTVHLLVLPRHI